MPATSFCEPNGDVKPATWHWFAINGSEPRPTFAFPASGGATGAGEEGRPEGRSRGLLVSHHHAEPAGCHINHERMPVLLTREDEFETWLKGSTDEALALAREYPPERMRIVREGMEKKDEVALAA